MTRNEVGAGRSARWLGSLASALVAIMLVASGAAKADDRLAALWAEAGSGPRDEVCFATQDLGPVYAVTWDASLGINARGTVVGTRGASPGERTGFVFDQGAFTEVGSPEFSLRAVNASGLAVGGRYSPGQPARAISWSRGVVTDLGTLEGGSESWSWAVNDRGVAVGDARVAGVYHAAAFYGGEVFDLGVLGQGSYANGINDHGDVVGGWQALDGSWHGFIVPRGGEIRDLGEVAGMPGVASADKIANDGTVCGSAVFPTGYHGYLWKDGTMTDLGDLGGGWSVCADVSDTGMAVGQAGDAWGGGPAFLWRSAEEGMIDLNTRIPAEAGVYLWWASGINSAGQIAAWGWSFAEETNKGYLLSPVACE